VDALETQVSLEGILVVVLVILAIVYLAKRI
jgi:hypothetical protein